MRLPDGVKITWWVLLVVLLTFLMVQRYPSFIEGSTTPIDALALVIWAALLLAPLFQEISLFGVSLKMKFEELKADVQSEIASIKSEIRNSVTVSPTFHVNPPPDSKLVERTDEIKRELGGPNALQTTPTEVLTVDERTLLMFKARYNIEKEIRRISDQYFNDPNDRRIPSVSRLAERLASADVIGRDVAGAIREVNVVASPAIHGEVPTDVQAGFVRDVTPWILNTLKAV